MHCIIHVKLNQGIVKFVNSGHEMKLPCEFLENVSVDIFCPRSRSLHFIWDIASRRFSLLIMGLVRRPFYLLLFNLAFIQFTPVSIVSLCWRCFHFVFAPFVTELIETEVSGCIRGRSQLGLHVQLRRLSSRTKSNWIPQSPTQTVRFNRAFKHSHWLL